MKFSPEKVLDNKVIFVGLDCATYWIVEKLVAEGQMPNLARLMQTGSTFHTETDEPVISPVVWSSIASAKLPEKHGIKSFHATSATLKTKRIWDFFLDHGFSVGIMGHFVTWPPKKVKGFMIPDLLALDDQTYPAEYRFLRQITESSKGGKRLGLKDMATYAMQALKHGIRLSSFMAVAKEEIENKLTQRDIRDRQYKIRVLKQRLFSDLFVSLLQKYRPKYSYFHNHLVDTCSHIFWQYLEPEKFDDVSYADIQNFGDRLFDAYREADKTLGKILTQRDENTLVVVASDHGAKAAVANSDEWRIPSIKTEELIQALDIEKQVSYANVGFDIIIKPRIEKDGSKEKLKNLFQSVTLEEEQKPLFEILEQDDSNIWLRLNNSIENLDGRHIRINGKVASLDQFIQTSGRCSGIHDGQNAILVLNGPGVKSGIKIKEKVKVLDIIPTILALTNMPIGRDMDGQVLTEAIGEDFLTNYPVQTIASYDDIDTGKDAAPEQESSEELKSQLRALGYL